MDFCPSPSKRAAYDAAAPPPPDTASELQRLWAEVRQLDEHMRDLRRAIVSRNKGALKSYEFLQHRIRKQRPLREGRCRARRGGGGGG